MTSARLSFQIGTYQMALCSKAHNKPFYVVAESFKFVRLYPLNQQDVPDKFKVRPPLTAFLDGRAPPSRLFLLRSTKPTP